MAEADASIFASMRSVPEREVADHDALMAAVSQTREPFIARGLVRDWPIVEAGLSSAKDAREHILSKAHNVPFTVSIGEDGGGGRLFYGEDMKVNFRTSQARLADIFRHYDEHEGKIDAPLMYLGSIDMKVFFDGLVDANPSPVADHNPLQSIWIGGRTRIAAHNDFPDNLACCAVGRRRFTLFPPDQFDNLYLGPIDNTPAGRAVSMVDFHAPDFDAFPRFADALEVAQVAELEPGDALFIPSMWWHHVEGLADFNVLINYWWRRAANFLGQPQEALYHAILAIRDLPDDDKAIWRALFDHYVFENDPQVAEHIPADARGALAPLTAQTAGQLRAFLLRTLSR
ncbi:cupin-like domain-containing protein [Qipengyuania sp. 1NDH17]|uniref:Cupin-like domain-containing protein n=1 Tax=Qipengyuania polymorpha TaxID=2867234 RepID=A0ABS7J6Z3_9SPHN|nr:cupin-like domain-containing protein [Qipengyuania polymorpha]MBX7459233.1 cupin-like domain-containing protein [Qipengyuania polymorpha]